MGLLSNTQTRSKMLKLVMRYGNLLTVLMYIGGVAWLVAITHPQYNGRVYFSENALLPGLVNSQYTGNGMDTYHTDYNAELKKMKTDSDVPLSWLKQELLSLGLEVYTQQYEFTYPLNLLNNKTAYGENIYAFIRAPRGSSTEAMVMSCPLRPSGSGLQATGGSIAVMLTLAKEMRKHTYWSKDIIFLFTQHEYVGAQAWLDAYLGLTTSKYIHAGRIEARGGMIQAAINLEFDNLRFGSIEVLIEGINGALPNLDLVNLVHKLSRDRRIRPQIHGQVIRHNAKTALLMMCHQATGMASGNHGLFLRYRIDAVTIKSVAGGAHNLRSAGELVEGVFRSINNLLEKFHQSFFFYILPSTDRYISIGVYMIPFALIVASALIQVKALMMYGKFSMEVTNRDANLRANKDSAFTPEGRLSEQALKTVRLPDNVLQGVYHLLPLFIGCHLAGIIVNESPDFFGSGEIKQLPAVQAVLLGALACGVSTMLVARTVVRKEEFEELNWQLLKSIALIYYGLVLFSLALLNISQAVILAVITLPVYSMIRPFNSWILTLIQMLLVLIFSPIGVMVISLLAYNHVSGVSYIQNLTTDTLLSNINDSLVYALIDSMVFNNYLVPIVTLVLYPIWLMMWSIIWMNV